jgi:hypothetical protein
MLFCWYDRADCHFYPRVFTNQGFTHTIPVYFTICNIMATESANCFNTVIALTVGLYQKLHVIVQIKCKLFPQIALTDCCL